MKHIKERIKNWMSRSRYFLIGALAALTVFLISLQWASHSHDVWIAPLLYVPVFAAVLVCRFEFTCLFGLVLSIVGVWLSQHTLLPHSSSDEHMARLLYATERGLVLNVFAVLGSLYVRQNKTHSETLECQLKIAEDLLKSSLWMDAAESLEDAADIALLTLQQRSPYQYAALYLRDDSGIRLTLQSSQGTCPGGEKLDFPPSLPTNERLLYSQTVQDTDFWEDSWASLFPGVSLLSMVPIPRVHQQPGGVLFVGFAQENKPSRRDLASIKHFAEQISLPLQRVRMQERLYGMAYTDAMTGLKNYRAFLTDLSEEMRRAARYERPLALILLDIDNFKSVNDRYGHPIGDKVLQHVASVLQRTVRDTDIAARYGGEEFVVLCPETEGPEAEIVAERIRQAMAESKVLVADNLTLGVTVSLGVAAFPTEAKNEQHLIDMADSALYTSKRAGRNRATRATTRMAA